MVKEGDYVWVDGIRGDPNHPDIECGRHKVEVVAVAKNATPWDFYGKPVPSTCKPLYDGAPDEASWMYAEYGYMFRDIVMEQDVL